MFLFSVVWSTALAQPKRTLDLVPAEASCFRAVVRDGAGKPVPLPHYISEHLGCGNVTLSPNSRWLTFVKKDQLLWWDFETGRTRALTKLPANLDGLALLWAPDSQRFAVVLIEQPSAVPGKLLVKVLQTSTPGEQRFFLPIAFSCAAACQPLDVRWESPLKLRYQTILTDPPRYETLSLTK